VDGFNPNVVAPINSLKTRNVRVALAARQCAHYIKANSLGSLLFALLLAHHSVALFPIYSTAVCVSLSKKMSQKGTIICHHFGELYFIKENMR